MKYGINAFDLVYPAHESLEPETRIWHYLVPDLLDNVKKCFFHFVTKIDDLIKPRVMKFLPDSDARFFN